MALQRTFADGSRASRGSGASSLNARCSESPHSRSQAASIKAPECTPEQYAVFLKLPNALHGRAYTPVSSVAFLLFVRTLTGLRVCSCLQLRTCYGAHHLSALKAVYLTAPALFPPQALQHEILCPDKSDMHQFRPCRRSLSISGTRPFLRQGTKA